MENKLKNISVIINKYRLHLLDLVIFANAGRVDQNTNNIFKTIFISIFTRLPKENSPFPVHIGIYTHAINNIRRSRKIFQKQLGTKDLSNSINIEEFDPDEYIDGDIFRSLESINKAERVLLCLLIRHKLGIDELATLFSSTPGTILSRISKSRIELARALINLKKTNNQRTVKALNECFYTKNMQTRQNHGLCSKEENSKINKHLQKCTACKNFYAWQELISKLIEKAPTPSPDRQINADIFYRLSKRSFLPNLWYTIYKSWLVRTSVLISLLALIIAISWSYYYDRYYQNINNALLASKSSELQKIQKEKEKKLQLQTLVFYKIETTTRRRITITRNINALLKRLGAKIADTTEKTNETSIFNKAMDGLSYFNVNLQKNNMEEFLNSIKKIDKDFEITKNEETSYDTQPIETDNIEIWVHRKNVK